MDLPGDFVESQRWIKMSASFIVCKGFDFCLVKTQLAKMIESMLKQFSAYAHALAFGGNDKICDCAP